GDKRAFRMIVSSVPLPIPIFSINDVYCYPNPTKDEITFSKLPVDKIKLKIYNIVGEKVFEREISGDINNEWKWDCRNDANEKIASGIYIYVISDGKTIKRGKLGIIK
ncbi:MAG: T9SS type A sorting domain-containing protein, partial [bacterium]